MPEKPGVGAGAQNGNSELERFLAPPGHIFLLYQGKDMKNKVVATILVAISVTACGDAPESVSPETPISSVDAKAPATPIDVSTLASVTWNCTINGNSQQWKFDEKNGFTMNEGNGTYEISGSSMNLDMGRHAGVIEVTTLTNDKLVFQDSDGITNCEKANEASEKPADGGGLSQRGRQINFAPF